MFLSKPYASFLLKYLRVCRSSIAILAWIWLPNNILFHYYPAEMFFLIGGWEVWEILLHLQPRGLWKGSRDCCHTGGAWEMGLRCYWHLSGKGQAVTWENFPMSAAQFITTVDNPAQTAMLSSFRSSAFDPGLLFKLFVEEFQPQNTLYSWILAVCHSWSSRYWTVRHSLSFFFLPWCTCHKAGTVLDSEETTVKGQRCSEPSKPSLSNENRVEINRQDYSAMFVLETP